MKKAALLLAVMAIVVTFAAFVWPTSWCVTVLRENGTDHMYRIHRRDGRVEVLTDSGWKPLPRQPAAGLSEETKRLLSQ